ncbi:MAG TPA: acyl-CoA dehydrogenase family protein [Myxococcaceae bacterium]|nr:acyl-CoA dehydrogenase family protein [Myxococcaceae bacterium]
MAFIQESPRLENQFEADAVLREYLERVVPEEVRREIEPELRGMGELSAGPLFELVHRARKDEPELIHFDPWGRRIDEIRVPEAWKQLSAIACRYGLVALPYEGKHGPFSRIHQVALSYLFAPSSAIYTCPLAMSDGAAKTLKAHGNAPLLARAMPRLTSRDPARAWTSGQWMTESTGGSDVGLTQTIARQENGNWRLYGNKWFTSATTSEMTLTLARPEGNGPGGKGLALFYLELRQPDGQLNGIRIQRLKDKLGTRMLPTAELELHGAAAIPVAGLSDGIKSISPMLQVTRTWNAICSIASMRRGIALARDYAKRRVQFGTPLDAKPLHIETLAELEAQFEAAFLLTFRAIELLGREEAGTATDAERSISRLLQPIVKLLTAKQAVAHASEVLEAFGGAGYVEDTGLPALLRDAQVLPIWEGTTNVLSLDVLRVIAKEEALQALVADLESKLRGGDPSLQGAASVALDAAQQAVRWFKGAAARDPREQEAAARAFALTLGRAYSLALVIEHAQWLLERRKNRRGVAVARHLAAAGVSSLGSLGSLDDARAIAFP